MKKNIPWLSGGLAGLFLVFFFFSSPAPALAKEGDCHLKHCLIKSPTVLAPANGASGWDWPVVKGLKMRGSAVKVFLDGQELTGVKQINHQDFYGSFYIKPGLPIKPGQHFIYTIAYAEKPAWYDQSRESAYVYFTVAQPAKPKVQPAAKPLSAKAIEPLATSTEPVADLKIISPTSSATFMVESGKIEGGVFIDATSSFLAQSVAEPIGPAELPKVNQPSANLQPSANFSQISETLKDEFANKKLGQIKKRNLTIGLTLLGIIILIVLGVSWAERHSIEREFLQKAEGDLPPPPQPPADP